MSYDIMAPIQYALSLPTLFLYQPTHPICLCFPEPLRQRISVEAKKIKIKYRPERLPAR